MIFGIDVETFGFMSWVTVLIALLIWFIPAGFIDIVFFKGKWHFHIMLAGVAWFAADVLYGAVYILFCMWRHP